jgi:hypothetical protein
MRAHECIVHSYRIGHWVQEAGQLPDPLDVWVVFGGSFDLKLDQFRIDEPRRACGRDELPGVDFAIHGDQERSQVLPQPEIGRRCKEGAFQHLNRCFWCTLHG